MSCVQTSEHSGTSLSSSFSCIWFWTAFTAATRAAVAALLAAATALFTLSSTFTSLPAFSAALLASYTGKIKVINLILETKKI